MSICVIRGLQSTITGGNTDNLVPIQKIHADKSFDLSKGPRKSESMSNYYAKLSQEPIRHATQSLEAQNPMRVQAFEDQNESVMTINSIENTPLTSRNNSKDDLRKYVKMVRRKLGYTGDKVSFKKRFL